MGVIFSEARPASASKRTKEGVLGGYVEEAKERSGMIYDWSRHSIDKITCGEERFIPEPEWKRGMRKESWPSLDKMSVLPFSNTVLLRCMRT